MGIVSISALTPTQHGILYHDLEGVSSSAYREQYVAILANVDVTALAGAWQAAAVRHAALRTFFTWEDRDEPLQLALDAVELPIEFIDWHTEPYETVAERWKALIATDRAKPFDVKQAPLARVTLMRAPEQQVHMLFSFHHLILDGWSLQLLLQEVYANSSGASTPTSAPFDFADYVDHIRQSPKESSLAYWRERLADYEFTSVPQRTDPVSAAHEHGGAVSLILDPRIADRAMRLARQERLTPGSVYALTWGLLISRITRSDDVTFGMVTSGRDVPLDGVQVGVGMFLNTLPLRCAFRGDSSGIEALKETHSNLVAAQEHGIVALSDLQRLNHSPLFDTLLAIENVPPLQPSEVTVLHEEFLDFSHYPLALKIYPSTDSTSLALIVDTRRFTRDLADRLISAYVAILHQLTNNLETPLNTIRLDQALEARGERPEPTYEDVISRFEARVRNVPNELAIVTEQQSFTYRQIQHRVEKIAETLSNAGTKPGSGVLLKINDKATMICAMLAVLRLQCVYTPLNSTWPTARVQSIFERLTQNGRPTFVLNDDGAKLEVVETDLSTQEMSAPNDSDLAYVMFTSGSTGQPKGVRVTRDNLAYSTGVRDAVYPSSPSSFLLLSPLFVDSSVAGIFWTLSTGGTLVVPDDLTVQNTERLLEFASEHRVTHLLTLSSLYQVILEHDAGHTLDALEVAIVAGEAAHADVVNLHHQSVPSSKLYNEYGPTEGTVWATVSELLPSQPVTIGRPLPGSEAKVVDQHLQPLPVGISGQLLISGPGIADGYIGEDSLAFTTNPNGDTSYQTGDLACQDENGDIHWLGRIDHQFKYNGFRLDPLEIEQVIERAEGVERCVVVLHAHLRQIIAYVMGDADEAAACSHEHLPRQMQPARFITLSAVPTTSAGKTDRTSLSHRELERPAEHARLAPSSSLEETIHEVWCAVLNVHEVSLDDDFFAAGGDSLLSIRVLSRLHRYGLKLEPDQFFAAPTIAGQAALVTRQESSADEPQPDTSKARATISASDRDKIGEMLKRL